MKIYGLAGYGGVGKDTIGNILIDLISETESCDRIAFADELKKEVRMFIFEHYGFDIFKATFEQKTLVRDFLVFWGEKRRKENPLYWIERVENTLASKTKLESVIITDVRYVNECDWVHNLGGEVYLLERPGIEAANETERQSISEVRELVDKILHVPDVVNLKDLETLVLKKIKL